MRRCAAEGLHGGQPGLPQGGFALSSSLLALLLTLSLGLRAGPALAVDEGSLDDLVITPEDNVVLQWNAAALQAVRDTTFAPPVVARALAIAHTAMFDAWATYDARADGTRLGGSLRRPATGA